MPLPEVWGDIVRRDASYLEAKNLPKAGRTFTIVDGDPIRIGDKATHVLRLKEHELGWVLNFTNTLALKLMFGEHPPSWRGKRVTLAPVEVEAFGVARDAVRVIGSPDMVVADLDKTVTTGAGPKTRKVRVKLTKTAETGKDGK